MRNYARIVINANSLFATPELMHGFFRRFMIIKMESIIKAEEMEIEFAQNIINTELPGILNWVIIKGLSSLMEHKMFANSSEMDKILLQYRRDSDNVQIFMDEEGWECSTDGNHSLKDLYADYKEFCLDNTYKTCSRKEFSARLKKANYETRRGTNGYYYVDCKKRVYEDSPVKQIGVLMGL